MYAPPVVAKIPNTEDTTRPQKDTGRQKPTRSPSVVTPLPTKGEDMILHRQGGTQPGEQDGENTKTFRDTGEKAESRAGQAPGCHRRKQPCRRCFAQRQA